MDQKHIVCFSKGHSSARVAIAVTKKYGKENVILLNHNINPRYENEDIKRFGKEVSDHLGIPLTYANYDDIDDENLIPNQFEVSIKKAGFKQPNTSNSFCTYELKTLPFEKYLKENFPHQNCMIYYGFDANEQSRIERRRYVLGMMGYETDFPLADWDSEDLIQSTKEIGIEPPLSYAMFKHANCIGCLKGGIQHWYVVYCHDKEVFQLGKHTETILPYTILKRSVKGKSVSCSLEELESTFERMKCNNVPSSEHYDKKLFKKQLKRYDIEELDLFKPCECLM